jgi:hypothetical protein
MVYVTDLKNKELEEPCLSIYSGFTTIRYKFKEKGLKWTISASPLNRKTLFMLTVK